MNLLFSISTSKVGLRLDQVVALSHETLSRGRASDLICQKMILVNGATKRPGYRVKKGDKVSGRILIHEPPTLPAPEKMALSILHEDDYILVVDKPPGQVVHPGPGHLTGTLVNGLLAHDSVFSNPGWDPLRPGIVHRLDMDTSGLILVAKTIKSHEFLQKEFKQRRVIKEYLALVQGKDIPDQGDILLPIGRHPKKRKLMAVVPETGKYARTGFRVKERFKEATLAAIRLYTGRTHQIRVHFYASGMPLLGDRVYQNRRHRKGSMLAPRQMLHSWRLGFRHPFSGRKMAFEASLPEDFEQCLAVLASSTS
ncbi:MAG: RluA family pseudouridine synthase [Desulfobacter sp.]|nr:RluA family pseudouridine synthase [Desulfobacter sp.]WDP85472.1 MAG: RluA family pseudouridine synthase [Desulfobacter sp.]